MFMINLDVFLLTKSESVLWRRIEDAQTSGGAAMPSLAFGWSSGSAGRIHWVQWYIYIFNMQYIYIYVYMYIYVYIYMQFYHG